MFLDFVGSRCGQSVKASLEASDVVVIEVDESILKRFDEEEDMDNYLKDLKHWEKRGTFKLKRTITSSALSFARDYHRCMVIYTRCAIWD